ncbi:hypothetical protein [Kibdelosporangium aridum]|uniref:hypothetical protein n=1 Tax=Kibdelosporangium aridum TaxID=2030 RepID=UPI000A8DB47D|nr:hypothetical protein [Kibdelosporangium aridum]
MGDALAAPIKQAIVEPNTDGRDSSDVPINDAKWFTDFMSGEMGGLYNIWCGNPCADPQLQYGTANKVRAMNAEGTPELTSLKELMGINWGLIADARSRFESLKAAATAASQSTTNGVNGIHSSWPDKAGAAAADKFNELAKPITEFGGTCDAIAKAADGLIKVSKQPVMDIGQYQNQPNISNMINKYRGINFGDKRRLIENVDKARLLGREGANWDTVENDWDGSGTGPISPADLRSTPGLVDINADHSGEIWADSFIREMDEFGFHYRNAMVSFRQLIENAYKAVGDGMTAFAQAMRANTTMFDALQAPGTGGGGDPKNPGQGGPKDTDTGGGGPKDTGGGYNGGPGDTGGGYQQPPPPPPPQTVDPTTDPSATDPTATDPSATDPNDPNNPNGTDPTQTPDGGAGKGTGGETVTIDEGGKKISVTSPDGQGHVKVTVDDGSGNPKTYDMDFSQPAGTPGAPGTPSTGTPGQSQPVLGPDGQPVLGPDGQPVQTMPAPAEGDPTAEVLKPGPDGKIVLEDGNVTITAEHPPGQPDVVKLTVDDGTGEPTTYTLDYSDPTNPQVGQAEPAVATLDGQPAAEARQAAAAQAQGFGGSFETDAPRQDFAGAGVGGTSEASFGGGSGSEQPLPSVAGSDQPVQTTSTQAVADFGGGGDGGFADSSWSTQGDLLSGNDDYNQVAPAAGEAGLAALPDDGGQPNANQATGSAMGGMPMMGGMGAGGGGGDAERSGGQWSVTGDLFADENEPARIAGVLDEDVR